MKYYFEKNIKFTKIYLKVYYYTPTGFEIENKTIEIIGSDYKQFELKRKIMDMLDSKSCDYIILRLETYNKKYRFNLDDVYKWGELVE